MRTGAGTAKAARIELTLLDRAHFGKLYGKTIQGTAIHSPRSLAQAVPGRR